MSEKVIFEFRAGEYGEGLQFHLSGDDEVCACGPIEMGHVVMGCVPAFAVGCHPARPSRRKREKRAKNHGLRRALDSLEQLYDDLYGDL